MPTATGRKILVVASAITIGALGLLAAPIAAQAAPICEVYGFAGEVTITGRGEISYLNFSANGSSATGGQATAMSKGAAMTGFISGGIIEDGPGIHLTFTPDRPLAGGPYVLTGGVRPDLIAVGSQVGGSWSTEKPLACLRERGPTPGNPGPPPPLPPTTPAMATVVGEDVDVYERPNINDDLTPIGTLRVNKQVQLVGDCQPEAWCQVKGPDVPTGQGFIWGHLDLP
jgi:hypothetical protein